MMKNYPMRINKEALHSEELRLRRIVDLTVVQHWQTDLILWGANNLISDVRERVLELFPDKGETFNLQFSFPPNIW